MATNSKSGIPVVVDTRALSRLAKDLRKASPDAWKAFRKSARSVAEVVYKDAQARALAAGPSPRSRVYARVANSMKIRVTSAGNVKIVAGGDYAPEAAAIENKGKGFVRHPVFPHGEDRGEWEWTDKNSRPAFLAPALEAHREEVLKAIEDAVVKAVERAIREH